MADEIKVTKSKAATELTYTENEVKAIAILEAQAQGVENAKTAKELGIPTAVLTSLFKKANDERPMAAGVERFVINKIDTERTETVVKTYKAYYC